MAVVRVGLDPTLLIVDLPKDMLFMNQGPFLVAIATSAEGLEADNAVYLAYRGTKIYPAGISMVWAKTAYSKAKSSVFFSTMEA